MRVYKIATASVALCSGLLLASFLKAAEAEMPQPSAQMNRTLYVKKADEKPAQTVRMLRPALRRPATAPVSAQMNRALYDR